MSEPTSTRDWTTPRLVRLCSEDSTTGREDAGLPVLRAILDDLGAQVELQSVEPERTNVLAIWGEPRVLFSTHLDTVPPFIPPSVDGDVVRGRGTCDAKGQIVAQLAAIRALLAEGLDGFAWLGVVAEETDSLGAARALHLRGRFPELRALLNGEPTHNRAATGQRGILAARLVCHGKAAHSGTPERGRSASWALVDWLVRLRAEPEARDADLGPEIWNLARLRAGDALNVVPDRASAEILVRSLPGSTFIERARELAPEGAEVETLGHTPPDRYPHVADLDRAPVPFGSDAPKLRTLVPDGTVVLIGPGEIEVAHSEDERISLDDLDAGVETLKRLARKFRSAEEVRAS